MNNLARGLQDIQNSSQLSQPEDESKLSHMLGQHYVSLSFRYKDPSKRGTPDEVQRGSFSGCVVVRQGQWFFVTAGHCLEMVDLALKQGFTIDQWQLNGTYGINAQDDFLDPFSFHQEDKYYEIDIDAGIDYGFIAINQFYASSLQHNNVIPLDETYWAGEVPAENLLYVLLGNPDEHFGFTPGSEFIRQYFVAIAVTPLQESRPHVFKGTLYDFKNPTSPSEIADVKSIVGMSGGPIFCCWYDDNGELKYQIVAIQSRWHEPTLTTYAHRMSHLVSKLDDFLDKRSRR